MRGRFRPQFSGLGSFVFPGLEVPCDRCLGWLGVCHESIIGSVFLDSGLVASHGYGHGCCASSIHELRLGKLTIIKRSLDMKYFSHMTDPQTYLEIHI